MADSKLKPLAMTNPNSVKNTLATAPRTSDNCNKGNVGFKYLLHNLVVLLTLHKVDSPHEKVVRHTVPHRVPAVQTMSDMDNDSASTICTASACTTLTSGDSGGT